MRQIVRYTILAACLASLAGCASFLPFGRTATPAAQQAGAQAAATQAAPQQPTQATPSPAAQAAPQARALPAPPPSAQTTPPASAQTGNIEIVNRTQNAIDIVVAGECDSNGPGSSVLPSGQSIAPGASRAFPVAAGCWDIGVGVTNVGEARQRMTVEAAGTVQYVIN